MKKKYVLQKKAGIWIDQKNAYIIRIEEESKPVIEKIKSDVEIMVRFPGEGKVFARFGNSFLDDQEKKQRRQWRERQQYFKQIIKAVHDADYIFLFGPGRAKEGLKNAFEKNAAMNGKLIAFETTDRLTRNQMIEKTANYFNSTEYRNARKKLRHGLKSLSA